MTLNEFVSMKLTRNALKNPLYDSLDKVVKDSKRLYISLPESKYKSAYTESNIDSFIASALGGAA